jgi:hypothetical protein
MNTMRPEQTDVAVADAATKFCISCGKSIARSAKFHPECGARQQ